VLAPCRRSTATASRWARPPRPARQYSVSRPAPPPGELGAGEVAPGGQVRGLERDEAAGDDRVDVLQRREDVLARADGDRQQRQVGGQVREAGGGEAAVQPVALDPAQEDAAGQAALGEARHERVACEVGPVGERLAEGHRQLQRGADHAMRSASAHPAPVASRPASMEPSRYRTRSPSSPSRWVSTIHVEKVV
jgi:hypothetical protein